MNILGIIGDYFRGSQIFEGQKLEICLLRKNGSIDLSQTWTVSRPYQKRVIPLISGVKINGA